MIYYDCMVYDCIIHQEMIYLAKRYTFRGNPQIDLYNTPICLDKCFQSIVTSGVTLEIKELVNIFRLTGLENVIDIKSH